MDVGAVNQLQSLLQAGGSQPCLDMGIIWESLFKNLDAKSPPPETLT